ncbi:hypothetical protein B0H14DRAFT_3495254 [Mycena olivaceomarginata]|nr:hypothetical protein B0H14DRAFT_3495254 [Mycena olivaceomarginata]
MRAFVSPEHTKAATRSPAGVGDLDVSARLQPFFSYSEEEKALLIASKDVVDASGPLLLYMTMWIAGQHVLAAKGEAEEKKKCDEIKANPARQTLKGTVPAGTYSPHLLSGDVGDRAKGEKILGDVEDEFKNLSPGKWCEALVNFARTLWIVSQEVPADAPPGWLNAAIEYEQHVHFFRTGQ